MVDYTKQVQDTIDQFKGQFPKVTFNKNGYEIRTKVLEIAKDAVWQDYNAQLGQFETSVTKEKDEIVTRVELPKIPGVDQVLEAAEKFYNFVNGNK